MFWDIVGAIASIIAIFAFVTGISDLSQLRRLWSARRSSRGRFVSLKPKMRGASDWSPMFIHPGYLLVVLGCAAVIAFVAYAFPMPSLPKWMPAPLRSNAGSERFWFTGIEALGLGFVLLVSILSHKGSLPRDESLILLAIPLFMGAMGLLALIEGVAAGLALSIGFMGFGGLITLGFVVLGETVVGLWHIIDNWRTAK